VWTILAIFGFGPLSTVRLGDQLKESGEEEVVVVVRSERERWIERALLENSPSAWMCVQRRGRREDRKKKEQGIAISRKGDWPPRLQVQLRRRC